MLRKRVIFFNAINLEIPSGGNSVTKELICDLKNRFDLNIVNIYPSNKSSRLKNFLLFFPSFIFRNHYFEFYEYLSKFSFYFFFSSYLKSFWKYDYVIFNHHQTFLFSLLFKGPKYLIVHDLISVKNLDSQKKNSKAVANFIESIVFRKSFLIFLSVDEKNHTFAKYEYKSSFLLDLYSHPKELYPWDGINIVLIGNYKRKENIISVENFFELFFNKVKRYELTSNFIFSIVGFGADSLISSPSINRYKDSIRLVNNYTNISEYKGSLHVSPLIRGAGLKIKLIEAYGAGIFTLGTKYTFQGVHQFLLSEMGVCANSIDDLVDILLFRREILYHPINIKVPIPNDLMKIEQILNKNEIR